MMSTSGDIMTDPLKMATSLAACPRQATSAKEHSLRIDDQPPSPRSIIMFDLKTKRRLQKLERALIEATTYVQWREIAQELDALDGGLDWREQAPSPHYDHELIKAHTAQLRALRQRHDLPALRDLIEESLHRNLGDLSNPALYDYAHLGTKTLILGYLDELAYTMDWLCDTPLPGYSDERKLEMVNEALRVFGRSALILSGGGALGLFHLGVVKALWEQDLLPQVISGASMGAIVAAGVCTRNDEELAQLWEDISQIHRRAVRIQSPLKWLDTASILAPDQLVEHVEANIAPMTFKESWQHSGRQLNIAVSPTRRRQKPRLLNALTSPDLLITNAAVASCSLPALFPPAELWRKDRDGQLRPYSPGERWVDGSLHGDVPTQRLGRLHNINHYIVSQANPHVVPFAALEGSGALPLAVDLATSGLRAQGRHALHLARRRLGSSLWLPHFEWAYAMAHQNYSGHITIHPTLKLSDYTRVMRNPDLEELAQYILSGERATWPFIAQIEDQTRISRIMEGCVARIQARISASHP